MLFANALVPRARGRTKKLRKRGPRLRSLGNERDLMFRFIAFLRAINVGGGRTVKMQSLRQIFESLGFFNVATFIASGNVVFETTTKRTETLERKIEKALKEALGYEVRTFVRGEDELAKIANYRPFPGSTFDETWQSNIIFLADNLNTKLKQNIRALRTKTDAFEVHGRELYWRRRRKQNGALFSTVPLEKILGPAFTVRGANTIKRIVSKYCPSKIR
ncbi:MAG: DUF1697 domain-containing protein [Pseudolabrys sp.]